MPAPMRLGECASGEETGHRRPLQRGVQRESLEVVVRKQRTTGVRCDGKVGRAMG